MATEEARQLSDQLARRKQRIVLAESCTAGLASALLAAVPGISDYLCGSWVTYREQCKHDWLGVPRELIQRCSAESAEVTESMAVLALMRTPSANIAGAITGHLGPDAPPDQDGVCYVAISARLGTSVELVAQQRLTLVATDREERQHEAAKGLLKLLAESLADA